MVLSVIDQLSLILGPPTSCRDVQTRNGVFSDGEYALMSKENRYVKVIPQ